MDNTEQNAYVVIKSDNSFVFRTEKTGVIKLLADLSGAETVGVEKIIKIDTDGVITHMELKMVNKRLDLVSMF